MIRTRDCGETPTGVPPESIQLFLFDFLAFLAFFLVVRFLGTFLPALRASDRPMAIACFLLFTVLPLSPLFNVPFSRSCSAFGVFACHGVPPCWHVYS